MRFQLGVKRKPPRGQRLSILLGRNWWDVSQSLMKAPGARTAIFSQSCSVKSHLLIFFRQDTTKKGLSTRHINFTIQEKLLHRNRGFFMIFCLKSHLFFLFFFGRETHRSKKRSYYYRKPRWGILFFRDYSRILYELFWDYTDRLGFQEDSHWIPFGLRDSIWTMGFHLDYLKIGVRLHWDYLKLRVGFQRRNRPGIGHIYGSARENVREKRSIQVAEPSPLSTSYPFDYKRNPFQIQHVQD